MLAALTDNGTLVIVASITAASTVIVALIGVIGVQLKVHRDNRKDHAETAAKVDDLVAGQRDIAADVRDVKSDVRDLREADRKLEARIEVVERVEPSFEG